eukprot:jgi/Mesen1/4575/ME000232S03837
MYGETALRSRSPVQICVIDRPPKGTKVYEFENFIRHEHCDILGLNVYTSDGELVSGDDCVEEHAVVVPVGFRNQLEKEASFNVVVPMMLDEDFLGTEESLLDPIGFFHISDYHFNFNNERKDRMPKAFGPKR